MLHPAAPIATPADVSCPCGIRRWTWTALAMELGILHDWECYDEGLRPLPLHGPLVRLALGSRPTWNGAADAATDFAAVAFLRFG